MFQHHYSQQLKVEPVQMSIKWTIKQITVCTYNEIVFSCNKEQSTHRRYNVDEPWHYYTKWEKTDIKGHMLNDFIYMKYAE